MPETWVAVGVALMGLGGVVAGLLGIVLPEGRRLGALFVLIAGAGVGVAVLGVGASLNDDREPTEFIFFLGSLLGFLAVCGASWALWRRGRGVPPGSELGG